MHDKWAKPASSPLQEQSRTGSLPQWSASSSNRGGRVDVFLLEFQLQYLSDHEITIV
jgi:hypothetical protein